MPPKRPFTANQIPVQKRKRTAISHRPATVHVPNSQPTTYSLPPASNQRDVSSSQHLSTSRTEYSYHVSSSSQKLLTCNERQTHDYMSGIPHTCTERVGKGREVQANPSLILSQEHLGMSDIYLTSILAFVNILIVNVKRMGTLMMTMILLIQQAL
jgi:hypothetical protein